MLKKFKLVVFIMLTIGITQQTFSQQLNYVGIKTENFNYYASSQRNSNWCWAASIQMILNYYGVNITQEQIVEKSYGKSTNGNLPNWTGSFNVITSNLNKLSADNDGEKYGPIIQSIVVRDPWPTQQNTSGRVEYPGISLANLIQAHWYIRVE